MDQNIRFCKSSDGVRLAYAVSGEGPPLVMSATWLTHLEHQWRSLAWRPWLDAFSPGHKLLRYDSRGCGLSDRDVDDLSFESWVRDLRMRDRGRRIWAVRSTGHLLGRPDRHRVRGATSGAGQPPRCSTAPMRAGGCDGRNGRKTSRRRSVMLDLTRLGWATGEPRAVARCGPRISSRAARSSTCARGATQMLQATSARNGGRTDARSAGSVGRDAMPRARSNVRCSIVHPERDARGADRGRAHARRPHSR